MLTIGKLGAGQEAYYLEKIAKGGRILAAGFVSSDECVLAGAKGKGPGMELYGHPSEQDARARIKAAFGQNVKPLTTRLQQRRSETAN